MSKMYVKDSNGKYILTEKDRDQKEENSLRQTEGLSLEELDARLKRVERIVIDPRR